MRRRHEASLGVAGSATAAAAAADDLIDLSDQPQPEEVTGQEVGVASGTKRITCACGKEFSKSYINRHKKMCPAAPLTPADSSTYDLGDQTQLEEMAEQGAVGGEASGTNRIQCACGREYAKSYINRHKKMCTAAQGEE